MHVTLISRLKDCPVKACVLTTVDVHKYGIFNHEGGDSLQSLRDAKAICY